MRYSIKPALRPGTGEERTVRLRVSWAGARLDLAAGVAVPGAMWDAAAGHAL